MKKQIKYIEDVCLNFFHDCDLVIIVLIIFFLNLIIQFEIQFWLKYLIFFLKFSEINLK